MISALEPYGGMYEALHFRDVGVFTVSCLPDGVDTATHVLSQVLCMFRFNFVGICLVALGSYVILFRNVNFLNTVEQKK